jgi:hypothetical protein
LVLLTAVVLMLWPPDPTDYTFTSGREQADGETVGWVSKVESNTIHVNSGPFGGGVVPLVVTKATRITVGGAKEGWFEDIRPGGQVKVAYELYQGRRFARSVELLVDEGAKRPVRTTPQLKSTAGTPAPDARPAPAPKAAEPAPAASVGVAPAPLPRPATATAKPAPLPEIRPAPRPEAAPAPVRPQTVEIVPPPQRASTPTPTRNASAPENGSRTPEPPRAVESVRSSAAAAPRPAEPARAAEGETTDGSAAVDWLLKTRR